MRLILTIIIILVGLHNGFTNQRPVLASQLLSDQKNYNFVFDRMRAQIEVAPNRINDQELERYLKDTLCDLSPRYCDQIRIYILDQPEFNAHMLPNGTLIVLTGLLLRIDNQAQLAYILAHELAHYVYKHGIKKINNNKTANSILNRASDLNPFKGITSIGKNQYSRRLENEADLLSIELLVKNKLPLTEVAIMFENLRRENAAVNRVNTGGFSSSHPGTKQRIKLFQQKATEYPLDRSRQKDSWMALKSKFVDQWLESELSKREFKSTLVLLHRLKHQAKYPGHYDFYLGEVYRKQGGEKNTTTAIAYYEMYLQNKSTAKISKVYRRLGDSYVELGRPKKARDYYKQYIEASPQANDIGIVRNELARL